MMSETVVMVTVAAAMTAIVIANAVMATATAAMTSATVTLTVTVTDVMAITVTVTAAATGVTHVTAWTNEETMGIECTVIIEIAAARKETAIVMSVGTDTERIDGSAQTMITPGALTVAGLMAKTMTEAQAEVVGRDRVATTAAVQAALVVIATVEIKMATATTKEAATGMKQRI